MPCSPSRFCCRFFGPFSGPKLIAPFVNTRLPRRRTNSEIFASVKCIAFIYLTNSLSASGGYSLLQRLRILQTAQRSLNNSCPAEASDWEGEQAFFLEHPELGWNGQGRTIALQVALVCRLSGVLSPPATQSTLFPWLETRGGRAGAEVGNGNRSRCS